jgi:hypothetical protein
MSVAIITYLVYLVISIALTIWVAHTLHKTDASFWWTYFMAMSRSRIR